MPTFTAEDGYARDYFMDCTPNANDTGGGGVLLSVPAGHSMLDADGANPMQNGGGDVRVTTTGGTQLALDVIKAVTDNDPNNGSLIISVPDGQSVYRLWWKASTTRSQPAAGSTYGQYNAYTSAINRFWPLMEDPSASSPQMEDRTATQSNLTSSGSMTSSDSVAGKITNAVEFDGSNDYLTQSQTPFFHDRSTMTFTFWVNYPRTLTRYVFAAAGGGLNNYQCGLWLRDTGIIDGQFGSGSAAYPITNDGDTIPANTWAHVTYKLSSSQITRYLNGSQTGTIDTGPATMKVKSTTPTSADSEYISAINWNRSPGGSSYCPGKFTLMRCFTSALTAAQISNIYSMENDNASFWTLGSVQSAGDAKKRRYKYSGGMQRLTGVR